ncbi:MAG: hypothetical protein M3Y35_00700 [Actinomycetota bacterium]|nr:hypothetical protein [Actinomycetota bacterium]
MATYRIYMEARASDLVEVEADNLDDAIAAAYDQHRVTTNASNHFDLSDVEEVLEHSTVDGEPIQASGEAG